MAGSWWEVHVFADPVLDDLIFWRMEKFGCQGTASELKGNLRVVRSYLPESRFKVLDLAALSLLLRQDALCVSFPTPIVQWKLIDEEDWASSWKQYWHPQEVGDRFLIYPAWLPVPAQTDRLLLRLDPGVAFGTGTHATTQLCLEALEMRLGLVLTGDGVSYQQEKSTAIVADIGCGSGILAIGAILLGAHTVYAVDLDPLAVSSTESNRTLNCIAPDRIKVEQGSLDRLLKMTAEPVDGFVCNILAEVIIELIPHFLAIAKAETWGILSGILLEQASAVAAVLEQNGWVVATLWKRGEWCCFTIRRF